MLASGRVAEPLVGRSEAREDGRAVFGLAITRGKRQDQEDCAAAQWERLPGGAAQVGLFAVFDGHGGPHAAEYAQHALFRNIVTNARFPSDAARVITEAFEQTDAEYLGLAPAMSRNDGCTAVAAMLIGQRLVVANVGDSRAVLSRGGKAVPLSVDHKPNLREERLRIERAGGMVAWAGTWRVSGVLAVSRAFGDRPLKRFVIATPDVREEVLTPQDDCVILATDGVWDVITNQEAVALASRIPDAQRAARCLVEEAYVRGSLDNISCVVVKFKF